MNSNKDVKRVAEVQYKGVPVKSAERAVIMIHGRGSDADEIMKLADELWLPNTCYIAPQAEGGPWLKNETTIDAAFRKMNFIFDEIKDSRIKPEKIFFVGFSQGGGLALEYAVRNIKQYGGIFSLSGALLTESIDINKYSGDFQNTPVFLGCSEIDEETSMERIDETASLFKKLNASVTKKVYPGIGKSIVQDEIDFINEILMK